MIDYSIAIRSAQPGTAKENVRETKAYGMAQVTEVITLNQFAKHISEHGSKFGRADVVAVIIETVSCLREFLLEGKKVQLGDLGNFSISLKSEGAETAARFTAQNIKAINVVWDRGPEFRNLIEDATFNLVPTREAQRNAIEEAKAQVTIKPGDITD